MHGIPVHAFIDVKDRSHSIAALSYTNQHGHPPEPHYASLSTIHPSFLSGTHICLYCSACWDKVVPLKISKKRLELINFNVKISEYMLPSPIFGTWANFKPQSLDRGVYVHFFKRSDEAKN